MPLAAASCASLRRPVPDEMVRLQAATIQWAATLPEAVRPRMFMVKFPRIANQLATTAATDPNVLRYRLNQLLLVDRAQRQGFPFTVLKEIAAPAAHFAQSSEWTQTDIWSPVIPR